MGARVSPVRLFTLVGALLGCTAGFSLPIYTVSAWPLITGGKPLFSIPAFVVIAFELDDPVRRHLRHARLSPAGRAAAAQAQAHRRPAVQQQLLRRGDHL